MPASCNDVWLIASSALFLHAALLPCQQTANPTVCLCIALQDVPLFNETIYYNIMYGSLGASQEEVFR